MFFLAERGDRRHLKALMQSQALVDLQDKQGKKIELYYFRSGHILAGLSAKRQAPSLDPCLAKGRKIHSNYVVDVLHALALHFLRHPCSSHSVVPL